jgi:hypothetical protein
MNTLYRVLGLLAVLIPGVIDTAVPSGDNYDKAEFRLWFPADVASVRAVVILLSGSNGDGRPMAQEAEWQAFAEKNSLALVGCRFTDKAHEQGFIEDYANVSMGSGEALLHALTTFAKQSNHPELASAPLLLWGMSAGGQFNYEFVAWKPERVLAFVVNKGGIYYTALMSKSSRAVPGMLFTGGKDLESRIHTITGLFDVNRRAGALWALAEEPGVGHAVGRSIDVARVFFEDVLALRLDGSSGMKPVNDKNGFVGDLKSKTFQPSTIAASATERTAWLPTERVARAWVAMLTEKPIELQAAQTSQATAQPAPDHPSVTVAGRTYTPRSILDRNMGTNEDQTSQFPPHKIVGNIYYVGTRTLSSFLIVTPQGNILINSTYERNVPTIRKSVEQLGFKFSDVKILLGSHAHGDHQEGDAMVKQLSGAQVMAMAEDVPALQQIKPGGKPHPVDRTLHDGDTVTLGGTTLVAHLTPGHTRGCTTWTTKAQEGGKTYNVVINCSLRPPTTLSPAITEEFNRSFKLVRSLPCDVQLGDHPAQYNMQAKFAKLQSPGANPFVEPATCNAETDIQEAMFRAILAEAR